MYGAGAWVKENTGEGCDVKISHAWNPISNNMYIKMVTFLI